MTISGSSETFVLVVDISISSSNATSAPATGNSAVSPSVFPRDESPQLSPFAQILSQLQQLQQQNPSEYTQVTQQVATNLQSAAQTAQANGDSIAANQLTQLATDFSNASQSGQLPNIGDLAQAAGGEHHHHHHHGLHGQSSSADSSSDSIPFSLAAGYGSQSNSPNPLAIILNTLSDAPNTPSNAAASSSNGSS